MGMTLKRNKNVSQEKRTTIGGQALIEGIFMMGPDKSAIVVNSPDGFVEKVQEVHAIKERHPILGWPFIRGLVGFGTSIKRGVAAIFFSADYYPEEVESEPSKLDLWIERRVGQERAEKIAMGIALVLGIALPIALFLLLPTALAGLAAPWIGNGLWRNLLEGLTKIFVFLLFLFVTSRQKDMKRMYRYHGAEHKTIHCYEAGEALTVENVRAHTRLHPRCGTSFIFVVIIISILVAAFIQSGNVWVRLLLHLLLLPVIVGVSYELNRLIGRYDNRLTRVLVAPGLWIQKTMTTREPDDQMIRTAIRALQLVIPENKDADRW